VSIDIRVDSVDSVDGGAGTDGLDAAADTGRLAALAKFLLAALHLRPETELSILLVDEPAMAELHLRHMGEPGPTDVLSFPMDELTAGTAQEPAGPGMLGDVVLCPSVAARQAALAGHRTEQELDLLLTHGVLHLLGHDHREPAEHERMFGLQAELLAGWAAAVAPGDGVR
jgi:probable rRNA maturation factor